MKFSCHNGKHIWGRMYIPALLSGEVGDFFPRKIPSRHKKPCQSADRAEKEIFCSHGPREFHIPIPKWKKTKKNVIRSMHGGWKRERYTYQDRLFSLERKWVRGHVRHRVQRGVTCSGGQNWGKPHECLGLCSKTRGRIEMQLCEQREDYSLYYNWFARTCQNKNTENGSGCSD